MPVEQSAVLLVDRAVSVADRLVALVAVLAVEHFKSKIFILFYIVELEIFKGYIKKVIQFLDDLLIYLND
ncbi:hypothetical protein LMI01_04710 [Companilactobacillus mindensis]|nr:hypothetical protein LMI01_04710 [Companilactobacillus mindensis]